MAFVKLDCGMLDSTIWIDRDARELFITALLMAEPIEVREPMPQIQVRTLEPTGFVVPVGWYGFVPAAGPGIVRRAGMEHETGMAALERLGAPEGDSRTPDFEGRRLVRVDGGFIALNFDKYRQKDHTAAERSRRYREKKQASRVSSVASRVTSRSVTQAEAEAEAYKDIQSQSPADAVVAAWNAACPPLPKCLSLSTARRAAVAIRLKDAFWAANYQAAILRAAGSDFALGKTDRGTWRMDFNFFIKPDSVAKIMEGKYDNRTAKPAPHLRANDRSYSQVDDYSKYGMPAQ